ncbi:AEC family transporter [Pararhizobium haloflavum]|uniref:AEC family transporter n=1 Tax=Pararhizobium haloflavum TaxID=2037914 RepID=UPI000C180D92|nr:AEC family transporter [Pararhizobium haloflavum]
MSVIFESILPIFLIVVLGVLLKRWRTISSGLWEGLDQFGYFVLFPSLLFVTLYRADFSGLAIGNVAFVAIGSIIVSSIAILAFWPLAKRLGVASGSFSTLFQTSTRWNAFVALAIADKLFGSGGLALVALVMALIILPINVINVSVLAVMGSQSRSIRALAVRFATNPLILGCIAGVALRFLPFPLYAPLVDAIDLIARAALGLGLLMVGAGLRIRDALMPRPIVLVSVALKLLAFPLLMVLLSLLVGIDGESLLLMALCGAVPTAMNGYLLARQMGGDAPLYAAITTVQTAASFLTIPLVLALAAQLGSG